MLRPGGGEGPALLLAGGYFFCILFGYYLLRPMRDAMGIRGELSALPWLWTGTTLAMLIAAPLFGLLVSRLPRRRFIPLTYHFFTVNLLVFFALFRLAPEGWQVGVGYAFYIWLSVFNLFAVAVFWGFMADVFSPEQGTRLFGAIGAGGTLGAICGSAVPASLVGGFDVGDVRMQVAPAWLLPVSAVMLQLAVVCVRGLVKHFGVGEAEGGEGATDAPPRAEPGRDPLKGFKLIATSPYLLGMAVYMLLYTLTSSYVYFEQAHIVKSAFETTEQHTAFFGRIDLAVNVLTLGTQLFLTGRLLKWLGVVFGLLVIPLVTVGGFAALAIAPGLATLFAFQVLRRGLHYAIDRPARETLYTVLGPEEKYKSKSFIDTFVYRGGDLLGAWTHGAASAAAAGGLVYVVAPIAAVWAGVGVFLARRRRAKLEG
jgi:ATP:ADP antiporter, AAA family